MEIERGSARSQSVENSFWKRLWTRRKTDCVLVTCPYFDGIHPVVFLINRWLFVWTVKVNNSLYSAMQNCVTCFGLYDHLQARMYIIYLKKQTKYIKIVFKFATSRKIYNYHNTGVLKIRNNAARF